MDRLSFHVGNTDVELPDVKGETMRTILIAMAALAIGAGTARAEMPSPSEFCIWEKEGAMGLPMTPVKELSRVAETGGGMSWYAGLAPHRTVAANLPGLTANPG